LAAALAVEHRTLAALRESPYGRPGASRQIVDVLASVDINTHAKPFIDRHWAAGA